MQSLRSRAALAARTLMAQPSMQSMPLARPQHTRAWATAAPQQCSSRSIATSASAASAPAVSSSVSSSSSSTSSRLLLLLGSSLLAVELVRASLSERHSCEAAAAAATDDLVDVYKTFEYNPPPPPHDRWVDEWDNLNVPPSVDPATGRPLYVTRHLLFIRHGQYVLPTESTRHVDPVLTERGREQARVTGARLVSLGHPISTIHVSSMARAKETAAIISEFFPGVPVQETELLAEGVPCAHVPPHPTWRPSPEDVATEPGRIKRAFEHVVQRWREVDGVQVRSVDEWNEANDKLKQRKRAEASASEAVATGEVKKRPGREEGQNFKSSARGTITLATEDSGKEGSQSPLPPLHVDRYELVVCHGNVIRYSLLRALQLPVQAWLRLAIWNCGISHLIIRTNGHVGLQTLGDTGHLRKDMITYH